jgi:hypothetical protein
MYLQRARLFAESLDPLAFNIDEICRTLALLIMDFLDVNAVLVLCTDETLTCPQLVSQNLS